MQTSDFEFELVGPTSTICFCGLPHMLYEAPIASVTGCPEHGSAEHPIN